MPTSNRWTSGASAVAAERAAHDADGSCYDGDALHSEVHMGKGGGSKGGGGGGGSKGGGGTPGGGGRPSGTGNPSGGGRGNNPAGGGKR